MLKVYKVGFGNQLKFYLGKKFFNEIEAAWNLSSGEFYSYQNHELRKTISYIIDNVPYYKENRQYYDILDSFSENIQENLNRLPILDKSTVKKYNEKFWDSNLPSLTKFHTTSGTSGTPLKIPFTFKEKLKSNANLNYWYKKLGFQRGWKLWLSGFMTPGVNSEQLYWIDKVNKNIYLSIYEINTGKTKEILHLLEKFPPSFIYGYASAVHQLALLLKGVGNEAREVRAGRGKRIAIVTSEVLYENWKSEIEENLASVYNLYGSQEGSHMVLQCKCGKMHINPMIGIVEILDENGEKVSRGESGNVVVTSLNKNSMPLIRYNIGDVAATERDTGNCECGLSWPCIGNIEGRSEDLVLTREGSKIGYLCFHSTKDLGQIREAQLIQRDYELFEMNIVLMDKDIEIGRIEEHIYKQIKNRLGNDEVKINFNYIEKIPRGKNGKFKAVVVEVPFNNE